MNRPLPPGDCGHRRPDPSRAPGLARAMPGARGLVSGIAIDRTSKTTPLGFIGIKQGGFARFGRETPCATGVRTKEGAPPTKRRVRTLAETVPELRGHPLRHWRSGCDCHRCQRHRDTV
jgi:hypothetical protein